MNCAGDSLILLPLQVGNQRIANMSTIIVAENTFCEHKHATILVPLTNPRGCAEKLLLNVNAMQAEQINVLSGLKAKVKPSCFSELFFSVACL